MFVLSNFIVALTDGVGEPAWVRVGCMDFPMRFCFDGPGVDDDTGAVRLLQFGVGKLARLYTLEDVRVFVDRLRSVSGSVVSDLEMA